MLPHGFERTLIRFFTFGIIIDQYFIPDIPVDRIDGFKNRLTMLYILPETFVKFLSPPFTGFIQADIRQYIIQKNSIGNLSGPNVFFTSLISIGCILQ